MFVIGQSGPETANRGIDKGCNLTTIQETMWQRIQNHSLDILGLARETVEPLDVRRDSHTAHAFKEIRRSPSLP